MSLENHIVIFVLLWIVACLVAYLVGGIGGHQAPVLQEA